MKQNALKISALLLMMILAFSIISCSEEPTGLWQNATYTEDTEIGTGAKTVTVEISAEEKTVKITINTDKDKLGDALFEHGIINDESFFDTANGIYADYDKYKAYWGFYIGEAYATQGVNDTEISGGEHFKLIYSIWG